MKSIVLSLAIVLVSTGLFAQAVCDPWGSPDPWGLGRPSEWVMDYTYYFGDNSVAYIQRDVCRGDPALTGDTSLLVWWSSQPSYCVDDTCQAITWPHDPAQWWFLPPTLEIFPRRRAASYNPDVGLMRYATDTDSR